MALLIEHKNQLKMLTASELAHRGALRSIGLCRPNGFQVLAVHNAFMEGNIEKVQQAQAMREWEALVTLISRFVPVEIIEGRKECVDMVFIANAALTVHMRGENIAVMSSMVYESRRKETPYFTQWLAELGYRICTLPEGVFYEGQGDSLWDAKRGLLYGGYGPRSRPEAYALISDMLGVPVILLELVSKLYHLDTCFCPLDEHTVLYCPEAFGSAGQALIDAAFARKIPVSMEEGETFVCNSLVLGKNVIVPAGAEFIAPRLAQYGFTAHFVPMEQEMKSGGAVRCCTLDLY